jgi:transketolase
VRNEFIASLVKAAELNKNIFLLCGDLGFSVLEAFADKFPDRFINVGIAEQNMMGIAAGLALSGKKVFTYSIVNFAITRCLEQIRNDVCYHNADVTLVAIGGGLPYGTHGYTHQGVEDIGFTRTLPNIDVYVPADKIELRYCMGHILHKNGPNYLRMARGGEADVHTKELSANKQLFEVLPRQKINFITQGTILNEAYAAVLKLQNHGIQVGLFSLPVLSPTLKNELQELATQSNILITVEEHLTEGGLGSFVAEIISECSSPARLLRQGLAHKNLDKTGNQQFLREQNHIDADSLEKFVLQVHSNC